MHEPPRVLANDSRSHRQRGFEANRGCGGVLDVPEPLADKYYANYDSQFELQQKQNKAERDSERKTKDDFIKSNHGHHLSSLDQLGAKTNWLNYKNLYNTNGDLSDCYDVLGNLKSTTKSPVVAVDKEDGLGVENHRVGNEMLESNIFFSHTESHSSPKEQEIYISDQHPLICSPDVENSKYCRPEEMDTTPQCQTVGGDISKEPLTASVYTFNLSGMDTGMNGDWITSMCRRHNIHIVRVNVFEDPITGMNHRGKCELLLRLNHVDGADAFINELKSKHGIEVSRCCV